MKDKKVIALIVLGVAAIGSLLYGIITPAKGRVAGKPAQSMAEVRKDEDSAAASIVQPRRRLAKTKYKTWRRDSFSPKSAGGSVSDLILCGILGTGPNAKAMIGSEIVRAGDKVGGNTVVEIAQDRVVLNDGEKNFELKLE